MKVFLRILFYSITILSVWGCASVLNPYRVTINTDPPGATVIVDNQEKVISPATVDMKIAGLIEVSKDGFWDEKRQVIFDVEIKETQRSILGDFIAGGIIGVAANPRKERGIEYRTVVKNLTGSELATMDGELCDPTPFSSKLVNKTIDITLKPISQNLQSTLLSLEKKPSKDVNEEIMKIYKEGKISQEEMKRARLKFQK